MLSRILVLITLICSYTINAQTVDEIIDNYFENTGGIAVSYTHLTLPTNREV